MSTAGNIIDAIFHRARAEGGYAFPKTWTRDTLLSLCQASTNAFLKRVMVTANLTLSPEVPVYDLDFAFTDCHQIVAIRDQDKLLSEATDHRKIFYLNTCWFRSAGPAPLVWSQLGNLLLIYPQPKVSYTVSVTY